MPSETGDQTRARIEAARQNSPGRFKRQEAEIEAALSRHPLTVALMHRLLGFTTLKSTHRHVTKRRRGGVYKWLGTVQLAGRKRSEDVYFNGRWTVPRDKLAHEVYLSEIAIHLLDWEWKRGTEVCDLLPDGEMERGDKRYLWELHTGSVTSEAQLRERFLNYFDADGGTDCNAVLWICVNPTDIERLRRIAVETVAGRDDIPAHAFWFGEQTAVRDDVYGPVFIDLKGRRRAITTG